ncbi:MAG: AtpZ/AtpI family protein [Spirochaetes bacterium]|nr:AtpZ/AtpI family protein [Spirochaetota bacterium]
MKKRKTDYGFLQYSTIGIQLAATVTLFVIGGYKLDEHLNRAPVFTTIGAFVGMVAGFYNLIKELRDLGIREKNKKNQERNNGLF